MNQKTQRLSFIRKIIRSEFISSQEELIARLEECGVKITQSTLSRDLKFMHVPRCHTRRRAISMSCLTTPATTTLYRQISQIISPT